MRTTDVRCSPLWATIVGLSLAIIPEISVAQTDCCFTGGANFSCANIGAGDSCPRGFGFTGKVLGAQCIDRGFGFGFTCELSSPPNVGGGTACLTGHASGGIITLTATSQSLQIPTSAGDAALAIEQRIADGIAQDNALVALGVSGHVLTNGCLILEAPPTIPIGIRIQDSGLNNNTLDVPLLSLGMRLMLVVALAASAALLLKHSV